MSKKEVVNLDDGGNWMVKVRTDKLKRLGWKGTLEEWQDAMELLNDNPLDLEPPVKTLEEAKKRAKKKR